MKLIPFKGRAVDFNRVVEVYRNLHAKSADEKWSIRQHGIIVAHAGEFAMRGVVFKVSEAGRQRVLRDKARNVHALLVGKIDQIGVELHKLKVSYNPYESRYFRVSSGDGITFAMEVWVGTKGVFVNEFMSL